MVRDEDFTRAAQTVTAGLDRAANAMPPGMTPAQIPGSQPDSKTENPLVLQGVTERDSSGKTRNWAAQDSNL